MDRSCTSSPRRLSPQEALEPAFKEYQAQILKNAQVLAEELVKAGFRLVSGGTDNHLMLVDLTPKGITGRDAEVALDKVGITVNKNGIPFDTKKPMVTSGIRIGTPAVTTRGMKGRRHEGHRFPIDRCLSNIGDQEP